MEPMEDPEEEEAQLHVALLLGDIVLRGDLMEDLMVESMEEVTEDPMGEDFMGEVTEEDQDFGEGAMDLVMVCGGARGIHGLEHFSPIAFGILGHHGFLTTL